MTNLLMDRKKSLLSFDTYDKTCEWKVLEGAFKMAPGEIIEQVVASKLVGRGGAGFPMGLKMAYVASQKSPIKYIICNADEGEPGTFKDRELLSRWPQKIIESMIIAAYAIGASKGYLYVRGEYSYLKDMILKTLEESKSRGYLGLNISNRSFDFDIEYRSGTGAYVCGEETALIESIEGHSGDPRNKPPYTAIKGLWGQPTLVNNVETLINLLPIMDLGPQVYKSYGTKESTGTKLFSVSGCVRKRGVYEAPFGISLRTLILDYCDGIKNDQVIKFIQIGGASGIIIPKTMLDIKLSYEAFKEINGSLGSGAIIVADESICLIDYLKATAAFFQEESCGKCTPCREGNRHIALLLNNISRGKAREEDLEVLERTCHVMQEASFCGLGQTAPTAILSVIKYFKDEMLNHINGVCDTGTCKTFKGGF